MRYADLVHRLENEGSRAWEIHSAARAREDAGHDVIVLSIGDPDFATPKAVIDTTVEALRGGRTHYTYVEGGPEVRRAIADHHKRLTGVEVDPDCVVATFGAQGALYSALVCVAGPGDEVIVPEPMYATYDGTIGATGATMVRVPLRGDRRFHLDAADVERAVTPRTRALLLNTPHNPTGAVLSRAEVEAIGDVCRRHDLWLVCDEVYAALTYGVPHVSPSAIPAIADRVIVVSSLSKSHAMCGWRVGWVIGPKELAHHLYNLSLVIHYGLPTFVQDAVPVALAHDHDEVASMRETFRARRDLVVQRVRALPGLDCIQPEGSVFLMVDVRGSGLSSQAFAWRLLEEADVAALPADGFGPSGTGYLRWSLTVPTERLSQACDRLETFVRGLRHGHAPITAE
jgi:arginine:pyruvate transaminase